MNKFDNKIANLLPTEPKSPLGDLGVNMFYGAAPILFEFAKRMRENPTEAESVLWSHLSNKQQGFRFKRQHPIKYFIADFYCHKAKLIIEVDGGYHQLPEQYEYDKNRDYELEELGLKILRFTNEQVFFDIENTIKIIEKELTPTPITPKSPKGDLDDPKEDLTKSRIIVSFNEFSINKNSEYEQI